MNSKSISGKIRRKGGRERGRQMFWLEPWIVTRIHAVPSHAAVGRDKARSSAFFPSVTASALGQGIERSLKLIAKELKSKNYRGVNF